VLDIVTWLSANNSVNSCLFLRSGIPAISSFCHLVIISSKYILNNVGEREKPWHIPLSISASSDNLEFSFIDILFCVCPSLPLIIYLEYFWISNNNNNNVCSSIRNIGCLQIFSSLLGSWR
jgi:hypothetical protein